MKLKDIYKTLAGVVGLAFATQVMVSCSDKPDAENYYTFTGEMVSDYLDNKPELYSEFTEILHRSGMYGMLATYGTYTCFAPTNEAIDAWMKGRYHSVADIPKDVCDTLAWNHIIQKTYFTTDLSEGNIDQNMNGRFIGISMAPGAEDGNVVYYVSGNSKLIVRDDSVENGVVHTLDRVIQPSSDYLPEKLAEDKSISLFVSALQLTGMADSLYKYLDEKYSIDPDSVHKDVMFHRARELWASRYDAERKQRYTVLAETNKVFAAAGINNLDDLKARAKEVYDEMYPNDAGQYDEDWTDRKNPLNRFVSYHLLPYYAAINDFTISESGISYKSTCAMPSLIDCTDWYVTMMPGSIMKFSSPSEGMFINRKGVASKYTVRGVKVLTESEMKKVHAEDLEEAGLPVDELNQNALNGIYHYIDDVLFYDVQTRDVVFNDRIRWNIATMTTEFLNAGARGSVGSPLRAFKQVEGWDFHGVKPTLTFRNRNTWNQTAYDAVDFNGQFDISFKLPPVPSNMYEIRFAYGADGDRGVVEIFFGPKDDMKSVGLPIDFRIGGGDPRIGWVADTGDKEEDAAIDKAMHNRGYLKEMDSWNQGGSTNLRTLGNKLRRILATEHMDPDTEYWIRIRLVGENSDAELPINYFEFCPKSVYAGMVAEDTH